MNLALIISALFLAGIVAAFGNNTRFQEGAKTFQALVAAFAILIAGYWYFVERNDLPHANISQKVDVVRVTPDLVAIEVQVSVQNVGKGVLRLSRGNIQLQQVEPARLDLAGLYHLSHNDYWHAKIADDGKSGPLPYFGGSEMNWPVVEWYDGAVEHQIEAGESDLIVATFLLRCSVHTVRIATNIQNDAATAEAARRSGSRTGAGNDTQDAVSGGGPEVSDAMVWKVRSFASLTTACNAK